MTILADFDQHFFISQKVQIFVKKFLHLHIIKFIYHTFQELITEINYFNY